MATKLSYLIFFDKLFYPCYSICSWFFPLFFSKATKPNTIIAVKLFGIGSITRTVNVLKNSSFNFDCFELITLHKNKPICILLGIKAHYIRSENLFFLLKDCIKTLFIIWRRKNVEIIDLERTSNLSGIFRLMCTIGNSCSSFTFKSENLDYKNQRFITLQNKTAFNAISEIFQLENKPISTSKNINKTNNIVININAGDYLPQRKYPINYFVKLIKNLHQHNPSFQFIFTGSKTEINYTNTLTKQLDALSIAYKNTAGKLSLNELAALLKNAQIFITNDSGPLHLAYYYKTPTVAIWGPTSAQLVGYPTSDNMKNVSLNKSCSPCFIHPKSNVAKACNNKIDCFKELDADKILDAVLELHQSLNKKTNVK